VIRLLADANIEGHIARLVARMQSETWREFWDYLELRCLTFQDVRLARDASDAVIWGHCQQHQILLLTNNRNDDGQESLEATIRANNTPQSLPVFTIGDADNLLIENEYADRVIDRLFRYLLEIENIRGTGRLYLP
jgi:hypothetical protein